MEFSIKNRAPEKLRSDCIVVGVFESRKLTAAGVSLDKATGNALSSVIKRGDMDGKAGSTILLHDVPGTECARVILVGLGKEKEFREKEYRDAIKATIRLLLQTGARDCTIYLTQIPVKKRDVQWRIRHAAMVANEVLYRFDQFKSKKDEQSLLTRKISFAVGARGEVNPAMAALAQGLAIADGTALARTLGNLPGNICTPAYLADQARELADRHGCDYQVLERGDMESLGMNTLLSVAKGTREPPKFVILSWRGDDTGTKPIVLIGKGITFDSGGISLKPGPEMDEMKFDMCGAASVLGAMRVCAGLKLPINVVALIPTTENMPGGGATRPGDIVTSMSGQTVEILNTDAEGRLILCDALTYAERLDPEVVIDVATLTGACVIALGSVASGLFSNSEPLARDLLMAGNDAQDRAWQMPLWEDYQEQLKSNFADMANIGGRAAGSITAACFLARYARKFNWAHLDIAGTAWKSGAEKGGTGRPVPLLAHYLLGRANAV